MRNKKNVTRVLALSSVAMAGSILTGCGPASSSSTPKAPVTGTVYQHTYTTSEQQYCLGAQKLVTTKIAGITGKITINSDDTAKLKDFCYLSFLYTEGSGKVTKINANSIEIQLKLGTINTCASNVIGPLPKTSQEIMVPIDLEQSVYVKFKTK